MITVKLVLETPWGSIVPCTQNGTGVGVLLQHWGSITTWGSIFPSVSSTHISQLSSRHGQNTRVKTTSEPVIDPIEAYLSFLSYLSKHIYRRQTIDKMS